MPDIAEHVRARAADGDAVAIHFEDQRFTWSEYVDACAQRAAYLQATLRPGEPPHVGVLFDNIPEFPMWLGAAALEPAHRPATRIASTRRSSRAAICELSVSGSQPVFAIRRPKPSSRARRSAPSASSA
jgi:fatty-acyl-CoA synthase